MRKGTFGFRRLGFRVWIAIGMAGCGFAPAFTNAQSVSPTDEYRKLVESAQDVTVLGAHPFGENVDLYTGALSFEIKDISVPGTGPALTLGRVLHTAEDSIDAVDAITGAGGFWRPFGDWDLDIPRIETNAAYQTNVLGWLVGSGSKNRCTGFSQPPPVQSTSPPNLDWNPVDWWYGYHLIVPRQGSQDLLDGGNPPAHQPTSGGYPIVTKQDWMIGCGVTASDGGEGFVALSPDGTRYTFAHLVYRPMAEIVRPNGSTGAMVNGVHPMENEANFLPRYDAAMYVTQVKDRFGNTLTYNWSGNNLTSIVASDGRELDFSYNSGTSLVHTVTVKAAGGAAARTWTYTYGGSSSMPTLTRVQLPDGSAWSYQIGNLESTTLNTTGGDCVSNILPTLRSSAATGSMTAPSGLAATFTLTPTLHGRSYVPKTCWSPYSGSTTTYANIPNAYYQFSLTKEVLSGPGISAETLTWSYSSPNASWTSDACASGNSCPKTVYTDVVNPLNQAVRYTFSNRFDASESLLQRTDHYSGAVGSTILRSETNTYANPTGGPWPSSYGRNLQSHTNFAQTGELSPLAKHVISQDGVTFTTTVNTFDSFARATSTTESSSLGYSKADTTSYVNDASHWVLGLVTSTATGGIVSAQTDYDSLDRPIHHYAFAKLESTSSWNADGTLHTITDGDNYTTTLSNWYRSVPETITYADGTSQSATVNGNGWITSRIDENGYTTNYGYDAMGRLASIMYPGGDDVTWNQTLLVFAPVGGSEYGISAGHWKQTIHTGNGYTITYLDAFWRPLVTEHYDSGNKAATLSQTVQRYDAAGRKTFGSYPINNLSSYATINTGVHTSYDSLDQVTQVQQDSELGLLTTTTAYQSGFETKVTDPRGYSTLTSYQVYGEPTREYPDSVTAPEGQLTVIMRDSFGKPLSITRTGTAEGSPQITRYYVYRPDYQTLCKIVEPETGATVMDFDGAGNLGWSASGLTLTDTSTCDLTAAWNSGRVVHRAYDARNRITSLTFPDGNGNQTWAYTSDGLPSTITRQNNNGSNELVTNSYLYDKRRLLTSEALTQAAWYTWTIGYGYDANGHLSSEVYPTGLALPYAPNALGQPTQAGWYATGVSYYPDGKVQQFTYHNGLIHTLSENARLLPSRIYEAGGGVTPIDQRYTYDKDANPTAITDYGNSAENRTMAYDGLSRLASGTVGYQGTAPTIFHYDLLDNLTGTSFGTVVRTYGYDNDNRLIQVNDNTYGNLSLTYDAQGNLASKGGQTYAFDYDNRLRWVNGRESYRYDALGRRILAWSFLDSQNILSMYNRAGQLMYQQDDRAGVDHHYIYLGSQLVATVDYPYSGGSIERYQHSDAQGTITAQTDLNRNVIERSVYSSWGGLLNHGNDDQPGYTGHLEDSLTGLTYMQQRYYMPDIQRFVSADPVDVDSDAGGNFNRYWYAKDNPYRYTDSFGLCSGSSTDSKSCNPANTSTTSTTDASPLLTLPQEGPDVFQVVGQAIATDIAYIQGAVTGNQALMNEAAAGFQESIGTKVAVATIFALGTSGEGGEGGEGIYEFQAASGKSYVGQSGNISARLEQHIASGKLPATNLPRVQTTAVPGGKTIREVAEQQRINQLGGVQQLENIRNPIGPARQYLLQSRTDDIEP